MNRTEMALGCEGCFYYNKEYGCKIILEGRGIRFDLESGECEDGLHEGDYEAYEQYKRENIGGR